MFHAISLLIVRFTMYLQYIPIRFRMQAWSDLCDVAMHGLSFCGILSCKRKPPPPHLPRQRGLYTFQLIPIYPITSLTCCLIDLLPHRLTHLPSP